MHWVRHGFRAGLGAVLVVTALGCGDDRKTSVPTGTIDLPKSGPTAAGGKPTPAQPGQQNGKAGPGGASTAD